MDNKAHEFAEKVAATYGVQPRRHGREFRCYCPVHEQDGDTHTPSLAIWNRSDSSVAFHCMAGCKHADVGKALASRALVPPGSTRAEMLKGMRTRHDEMADAMRRARDIFSLAKPLSGDDPASLYLTKRGIIPREGETTSMRVLRSTNAGTWLFVQAIVDLFTLSSDQWHAVGVQITYIDAAGNPHKVDIAGKQRTKRKIIGLKRSCGVVIGKPAQDVVIGEGVESTWSAVHLLQASFGIAALGTLTHLVLPANLCRYVTISADNDRAGIDAAYLAGRQFESLGAFCGIKIWGEDGDDANDVLLRQSRVTGVTGVRGSARRSANDAAA